MEPGVLRFDKHVILRLEIILCKATFRSEALPAVSRLPQRLHSLNSASCTFWEIVSRAFQQLILFVLHFHVVVLNVNDTTA